MKNNKSKILNQLYSSSTYFYYLFFILLFVSQNFTAYSEDIPDDNDFFFTIKKINELTSKHPSVLSAASQTESARIGVEKQYMFFLPFSADMDTSIHGTFNGLDTDPLTASVSMDYAVFDWKAIQEVNRLRILEELAAAFEEDVRDTIFYKIVNLILSCNSSRKRYELFLELYNSAESYTELMEQNYEFGNITKTEMDYAYGNQQVIKGQLLQYEFAVNEAVIKFEIEAGEPFSKEMTDFQLPVGNTENSKSQILEIITNRADIRQSFLLIDALQQERKGSYSNIIPLVKLTSSLRFPFDTPQSWKAGLNITIPLSSIGYDIKQVQQVDINIISKSFELEQLIKDEMVELLTTERKMSFLEETIEVNKQSTAYSKSVLESLLIESEAGMKTVFDVIEARNNLALINLKMVNNEINLAQTQLEYLHLIRSSNFEKQ